MAPIVLRSDRLTVELSPPGETYTSSRFDWTTQVRQVTLGTQTYLTREKEAVDDPSDQGWGLAGEFGIETPVGYQDCPVGGFFPKIGVGLLRKPDEKPYFFARGYEVQPARFEVKPEGPRGVLVTASATSDRGYGWFLKRHWSVAGTVLTLTTTLANTGTKPLSTEEYIHNFFGFAGQDMDGTWSLTLPRPLVRQDLSAWVDPTGLMALDGNRITWSRAEAQDWFLCDPTEPRPGTWTLRQGTTGASVTEETDFPVSKFAAWGRGHVASPELYRKVEVATGSVLTWTRKWTFA